VLMNGAGTLVMTGVQISDVAMGVEATAGNLTIKNGTIGFKNGSGNYGVKVGREVTSATLTGAMIRGTSGNGVGSKGVIMESTGTLTMTKVDISNVG
ncbi:hypothetical protein, partial [Bartonella bovis]|uniref:hypothetical protein n=1 Tax=Bartonella bovis TaxID=155194 RepID=UPI001304844D